MALKNVRHALAAGYLMGEDGGRTLVRAASHFARPHRNAVAHAARSKLEPKVGPIMVTQRLVKPWLVVEVVEIGTDKLAILHANASIIDEVGYAARGIDLVVRAVTGTRLCLDNLDAVLERFLYNNDAC
jgi:hypothetical protein